MKRKDKSERQGSFRPKAIEQFLNRLDKEFQKERGKVNARYPYNKETNTIELPPKVERELRRLIMRGEKIEAVKQVTELTGAGLRVSKGYVDGLIK